MKKTLLFLVMLTAVSSVASARRMDEPAALTRMAVIRSGDTFKVFYKSASINKVSVTIYDANGATVFNENLGKLESFMRPYNFSTLPNGDYTIELQDALGKQIEQVAFTAGKLKTGKKIAANLIKIASEKSKYLLMIPEQSVEVVKITIRDNDNTVLYTGSEPVSGDFAKIYDIQSEDGKFSLELTNEKGQTRYFQY